MKAKELDEVIAAIKEAHRKAERRAKRTGAMIGLPREEDIIEAVRKAVTIK